MGPRGSSLVSMASGEGSATGLLFPDPIAPGDDPGEDQQVGKQRHDVPKVRSLAGEHRPTEVREMERRQHPADRSDRVGERRYRCPQPTKDRKADERDREDQLCRALVEDVADSDPESGEWKDAQAKHDEYGDPRRRGKDYLVDRERG